MKLSPAQRKVLEVMADGTSLRREVKGCNAIKFWDDGCFEPIPTGPTLKKLAAVGLIQQAPGGIFAHVYTITPQGREALK